jgi:hypothetical protein
MNTDFEVQKALKIKMGFLVFREREFFIYRRPTLYPVEIAVDFLKSL